MKILTKYFIKTAILVFYIMCTVLLLNSAVDIYNNFAYDTALVKDSPFGLTPLLLNPKDYNSAQSLIKSGDFVYVVDWLSAYENNTSFAKVKSKFKEGYINNRLLIETNINIKPIISVLLLTFLLLYLTRNIYIKFKP